MGSGISGGYSNTKGSSSSSEALVKQLEQSGVKFSKKDMVFVTKDKTGQVVWLEKGSSSAGLKHILDGDGKTPGHAEDFQRAFGISRSEIPAHIEKVITNGKVVNNQLKPVRNRMGYERTYYYNGEYYVVTGIGSNGYIVSAYPKRMRK